MRRLFCYKAIIGALVLINACLVITTYTRVSKKYTHAPVPMLSEENKVQLNKYTDQIHNFVGLIVVSADIQSNSTQLVYMNILDPVVNSVFSDFINDKALSDKEPLFVKHGDEINTRIVNLINHEFVCTPFSSTVGSRFLPLLASRISVVCSISVPPSFGEFNGIINVFLSKPLTAEEVDTVRTLLKEMSHQISENLKSKN
jgi:hypothetical protein